MSFSEVVNRVIINVLRSASNNKESDIYGNMTVVATHNKV
jgi:hypothetical protein